MKAYIVVKQDVIDGVTIEGAYYDAWEAQRQADNVGGRVREVELERPEGCTCN